MAISHFWLTLVFHIQIISRVRTVYYQQKARIHLTPIVTNRSIAVSTDYRYLNLYLNICSFLGLNYLQPLTDLSCLYRGQRSYPLYTILLLSPYTWLLTMCNKHSGQSFLANSCILFFLDYSASSDCILLPIGEKELNPMRYRIGHRSLYAFYNIAYRIMWLSYILTIKLIWHNYIFI